MTLRMTGTDVASVTFTGVLHVPGLTANLLSTETLKRKGLFYRNDTNSFFNKAGMVVAKTLSFNGLPHLQLDSSVVGVPEAAVERKAMASSKVIHP